MTYDELVKEVKRLNQLLDELEVFVKRAMPPMELKRFQRRRYGDENGHD